MGKPAVMNIFSVLINIDAGFKAVPGFYNFFVLKGDAALGLDRGKKNRIIAVFLN